MAQIGGESTYQFLELTNSARIAALGGTQAAIYDKEDLSLPYFNPAALSPEMNRKIVFNYVNYLSDVNFGYAVIAKSFEKIGNFAVGVHYINYGKFKEAEEGGKLTGNNFSAAEYALNIFYSNRYKQLSYGVNLKPIYSSLEKYNSFGLAADFGVSLVTGNELTNFSVVVRNVGTQLSGYYKDADKESLPVEVQAGVSKKFKHAPIALSLTLQHLNNWNLQGLQDKNETTNLLEKITLREESFGKQLLRHAVFGVEVFPIKNFILRAGYNYQRRQELSFSERPSTVGMSAGFGIKLKRFQFDFGIAHFHLAGSSMLFSLGIDLNRQF